MTIRRALRSTISGATLALSLALAAPVAAQSAWGTEATDVQEDPAITYGVLDNGMRYAIRHNDTPDASASFRLHIDFGSFGESEEEQGLAHFIEHMAFNGTTNVPEGEMIPLLERLGASFGADTNAYTSFEETVYMLDIPNANEEGVDTALFLMRETASEMLFEPEAVDREREIIVSERRTRDSAGLRNFRDMFDFRIPGTRYVSRFPIGTDATVRAATSEMFRSLYQRFYRPENATLIVVGDIDVEDIEAQIIERFSDWRGVGEPGVIPPLGDVDFDRSTEFDTFVDPAIGEGVAIYQLRPYTDPADTLAERTASQLRSLSSIMFNRRIERISNQPDSPILGGGYGRGDDEGVADFTSLSIQTRDGQWERGLAIAEQELRRALQYGFTQSELDYALTQTSASYTRAAAQADARTTSQLAGALVNAATENDFITTPAFRLEMFEAMRPQLTLDAVNETFREAWSVGEPLVRVTAKELEGGEEAVATAFMESTRVAVAPPEDSDAVVFAYDDWGTPGTVVSDDYIEDLGIRTVTFANNVRLNIKQTDFEPGRVRFNVSMDGGNFALGDMNSTAAGIYLQIASDVGGTQAHSADELQEALAGRQITTGIGSQPDTFGTGGVTTPDDLDLQMKVSAAFLTDLGLRPEADARFNAVIEQVWNQVLSQPGSVFGFNSGEMIVDSPYFAFPTREDLDSVDREALLAAIQAAAANGAIEIGIVGDIDPDAAIAAVAQSFGALPTRNAEFAEYAEQRAVTFKDLSDDTVSEFTHTGQDDQALVGSIWRTTDNKDYAEAVALDLLVGVLRLKGIETLREEFAATYSPSVGGSTSGEYDGYGTISMSAVVDPNLADDTLAIVHRLAAELRDAPVSEDFLLRARQPVIENIRQAQENNGYWLGLVSDAQSYPEGLDRARVQIETIMAVTPEQLQALAQQYLVPERRADARVLVAPSDDAGE
ncbi:M16 family metallopeptidase [Aurantiacibacter sp. D1-12]|uniref:M16 family metallopeptidase n=1 Tax=Aurantiacibacter sp. D1-12 TaxID=2993658 RepID=UPI00237CE833|nr:M16 family metallopeptidase [Aurantiacibacter sp. D1-12]MDE1466245.1 insulinase family protein [Aurantiacibacter sp. D1-12]